MTAPSQTAPARWGSAGPVVQTARTDPWEPTVLCPLCAVVFPACDADLHSCGGP